MDVLREKAEQYCRAELLDRDTAGRILDVIAGERRALSCLNDGEGDVAQDSNETLSSRLTLAEMRIELAKREEMLRDGPGDMTDQWRVYEYITDKISKGEWLRLIVQASAGTGTLGG